MNKPKQSPEERFWAKVDKTDGCWLWTGARDSGGYGYFTLVGPSPDPNKRKTLKAHRFSWTLSCGPIPNHQRLRHKCDVRLCVNPTHLELGSIVDNNSDMYERGRGYGQFAHQKALLTDAQAEALLESINRGIPPRILAKKYGLTLKYVERVKITREFPDDNVHLSRQTASIDAFEQKTLRTVEGNEG